MPKILHSILSNRENWDGDGKKLKQYINSDSFTKDQYVKFLSGAYTDDFYDLESAVKTLKGNRFDTKENNDKAILNVLKSKPTKTIRDEGFYWRSELIGKVLRNLKHSAKSLDNIIDHQKKIALEEGKKNLLSQVTNSPEFNKKHIKRLLKETDFLTDEIIKHPEMDSKLFNEAIKGKKYENLPASAFASKFLDAENALRILNSSNNIFPNSLDNLLSKLPKSARKDYIHEKLGITGGELMPEDDRYDYYDDAWRNGPGRSDTLAEHLAESKHLTPEAIEHIKEHGNFDERYKLFTNEQLDPKHAVEMAVKWANNDENYDEDELKEKIKEESDEDLYETYGDDAREKAQEEYSMDQYLNDIGDDDVSRALFGVNHENWKKDWIKENRDLTWPNPNFNPNEPEDEESNPKNITYNEDEYDVKYPVEDHPNYSNYESDAESAFEEAKRTADLEPFYDGYDESIQESVNQYVHDLRDEAIDNWTENEHLLPKHVYDKLKSPFKDKDNPTESELDEALNHPLKITRNAAAKNSKLTPRLIDKVLKGDDDDAKARVLSNPNVTSDQLMTAIKKSKDTDVLSNALKNIKARPEHIQEAINRHATNDEVMSSAFDSPSANDEHVKNFLSIAKQSEDYRNYNLKSVLDSKFNISPEDVKFIYDSFDKSGNDTGLSNLLEHHSSTKDIINQGLNHRYENVKNSAKNALDRRFPQTADPVKVKIGTHPLRILRDLVADQGGTVSKGKLKSMGVNADKFSSIFKPNGTISAEDVQKIIDSAPSKTYNTSHSTWTGGQRHSNEASKVFQLNYTQEHLDQMHKEGVLDTFKKIYDVSFRSGHPVKNNTIGWVRYTGTPETGFHIDEIQSDLGQSIIHQTIQQAKHAMENEGISQEEAERAVANAKRDFPDEHLKKINNILFGDKHPSEVLHEGFKEYVRNRGFGDSPIHIWQPESKAPISGMSLSTKIGPTEAKSVLNYAKKGNITSNSRALIAWGQKNKIAPASFKEITEEHLDQIGNQYEEFANKHREQHNTDPELPLQLPVHMVEGYGKIPKSMGYKESFYGKLPTQSNQEHLAQENIPAKQTFEEKVRKQEELNKTPTVYDIDSKDNVVHNSYPNIKKIIHRSKDNKGFEHRVKIDPKNDNEILHTLHSPKGEMIAQLKISRGLPDDVAGSFDSEDENIVSHVTVSPYSKYRGKGFGRKLYLNALKYHRSLTSDSTISPMANKVWKKISKLKNVYSELAPYNEYDSTPHRAEWHGKSEELDKGLKGDWEKEGYTIKEADPGKYYDYAIEAVHPEHGVVGRARFKAHSSGKYLIPGDIVVKPEHQRKGLGSAIYQHAKKVYAPILNRASHQTLAANAMWEKMGHTFGKEELNKNPLNEEISKLHDNWTEDGFGRDRLHSKMMEEANSKERNAMLKDLETKVPTKIINGKKHYLLHRRHGHVNGNFVAHNEITSYSTFPKEKMNDVLSGGHIHSAWIPENKISYSYDFSLPHHTIEPKSGDGGEGEVIVGAGKYPIHEKFFQTQMMSKPIYSNDPNYPIEWPEDSKLSELEDLRYDFSGKKQPIKINKSESNEPMVLYHYSKQPGLKEIDPKRMGTGVPGQFKSKFDPSKISDFPHASFHYIQDKPEDMVRSAAKAKYVLKLNPDQKLYDITEDKDSLVRQAIKENQGAWNYEAVLNKIKNAGYYGVMAGKHEHPVIANTVQLFYNHPVEQELNP